MDKKFVLPLVGMVVGVPILLVAAIALGLVSFDAFDDVPVLGALQSSEGGDEQEDALAAVREQRENADGEGQQEESVTSDDAEEPDAAVEEPDAAPDVDAEEMVEGESEDIDVDVELEMNGLTQVRNPFEPLLERPQEGQQDVQDVQEEEQAEEQTDEESDETEPDVGDESENEPGIFDELADDGDESNV